MRLRKSFLFLLLVILFSACSENLFITIADKTSDEALYIDAREANDSGDYTTVISKISEMSTAYQARDDVTYLLASAYASLCGLNFFNFSEAFNGAGSAFFEFLLEYFTDSDTTDTIQNYCQLAESTYDGISTSTEGDAINRVFISLSKMGAILNKNNEIAGDGDTLSTNIDPCAFSDTDANHLYTAFTRVIQNLAASGLGISGVSCTDAGNIDCSETDPDAVNNDERLLIKNLIDGPNPGLALGTGGDCS